MDPDDLPVFRLTNQEESIFTDDQVQAGDTVVGFGLEEGSVRLAELLLNMSLPHNSVNEYVLEREGSYRGVGTQCRSTFFLAWKCGVGGSPVARTGSCHQNALACGAKLQLKSHAHAKIAR